MSTLKEERTPLMAGKAAGTSFGNNNSITSTTHPVLPFKYDWQKHAGVLQTLKMILVGLVLFPPRFIIFLFSLFFLWLTAALMTCGVSAEHMKEYPVQRTVGRFFLRLWSRVLLWCMGYWWISVTRKKGSGGVDGVPKATIITPNHCAFVDAFYFAYADIPMAVGKAQLSKLPVVGTITKATQTVFVSRESSKARHGVADEINRRTRWMKEQPAEVIKKHGNWPPLLIFPEATCVNAKVVIQFKAGAFNPMMPVQPVRLDYQQDHLDVSWVGGMKPPLTLIRMMCQVYNRLHVTYLPIEHPTGQPDDTPFLFAERVRKSLAKEMGVPLTNHTFFDNLLQKYCKVLRLPPTTANVEMGSHPNVGIDEAKRQLKAFKALDKDGDGLLNREEFAQFLGIGVEAEQGVSTAEDLEGGKHHETSMVQALLSKWDVDGDGKINFREFLFFGAILKARHLSRTLANVSKVKEGDSDSTVKRKKADAEQEKQELLHAFTLCFGSFDRDGDGQIERQDFVSQVIRINHQINRAEVESLFDRVDSNSDGIIGIDEYLKFCEGHPELVMTFLDALALSDAELLDPEDRSNHAVLSRENSFLSEELSTTGSGGHDESRGGSPSGATAVTIPAPQEAEGPPAFTPQEGEA